eukprot:10381-Heterococcus_DN1.PRE.4
MLASMMQQQQQQQAEEFKMQQYMQEQQQFQIFLLQQQQAAAAAQGQREGVEYDSRANSGAAEDQANDLRDDSDAVSEGVCAEAEELRTPLDTLRATMRQEALQQHNSYRFVGNRPVSGQPMLQHDALALQQQYQRQQQALQQQQPAESSGGGGHIAKVLTSDGTYVDMRFCTLEEAEADHAANGAARAAAAEVNENLLTRMYCCGSTGDPRDDPLGTNCPRCWAALMIIVEVLSFLFGTWAYGIGLAATAAALIPSSLAVCCMRTMRTWVLWGHGCFAAAGLHAAAGTIGYLHGSGKVGLGVHAFCTAMCLIGRICSVQAIRACATAE